MCYSDLIKRSDNRKMDNTKWKYFKKSKSYDAKFKFINVNAFNIIFQEGRTEGTDVFVTSLDDGTKMIKAVSKLKIIDANPAKDQGKYTCHVEDSVGNKNSGGIGIVIQKNTGPFLKLYEFNGRYKIETDENKRALVQWILDYSGNPNPGFFLIKNNRTLYPSNDQNHRLKYELKTNARQVYVRINNHTLEDSGEYIFRASNGYLQRELKLQLVISAEPKVYMDNVSVMVGEEVHLECQSRGYPPSDISWFFLSCPTLRNCETSFLPASGSTPVTTNLSDILQVADIIFTPSESGIVVCNAKNSKGNDTHTADVRLNDIKYEFQFLNIDKELVQGEPDVTITCAASVYSFQPNIVLKHNGQPIQETDNIKLLDTSTKFSYRKTVHFKILSAENAGQYKCFAMGIDNSITDFIELSNVIVHAEAHPSFYKDSKEESQDVTISEPFIYQCEFKGTPLPRIEWYKDGVLLVNNSRMHFFDKNMFMNISHIAPGDDGEYKCVGINRLGSDSAIVKLKIKNLPMTAKYWLLGLLLVILILAVLLIVFYIRIRRARAVSRDFQFNF